MNYTNGTGGDRGEIDGEKGSCLSVLSRGQSLLDIKGAVTKYPVAETMQISGRLPVASPVRISANSTSAISGCDLRVRQYIARIILALNIQMHYGNVRIRGAEPFPAQNFQATFVARFSLH
jgi:hypothetical protein